MKQYTYIVLKVIFSLILLLPIVSIAGMVMGQDIAPKPEYYSSTEAYTFIKAIMDAEYIMLINTLVFIVTLVLLWTRRTALAAVIIFPITLNIVAFHAFLDGGLLTGGAVMGNIMLAINIYFMWYHWEQYQSLFRAA